jgi:ABC-2 type transport system ATP-binding protein
VSWGGRPIDQRARARIGYMPEERGLYPKMRIGDQLEYFGVLRALVVAVQPLRAIVVIAAGRSGINGIIGSGCGAARGDVGDARRRRRRRRPLESPAALAWRSCGS